MRRRIAFPSVGPIATRDDFVVMLPLTRAVGSSFKKSLWDLKGLRDEELCFKIFRRIRQGLSPFAEDWGDGVKFGNQRGDSSVVVDED
jgi:hypothetical protein